MKIEWKRMQVSPKMAEQWMKQNSHNRIVSWPTVHLYSTDMADGRWVLTHQGIAFSDTRVLLDGQKRLLAIIESGAVIEMFVCFGLPLTRQQYIDLMEIRSIDQQLHLQDKVVDAKMKVAAIRKIAAICCGKEVRLSLGIARILLDEFGDDVSFVLKNVSKFKQGKRAWVVGPLALARNVERTKATRFIEGFGSGDDIRKGNPAKTARDWLTNTDSYLKKDPHKTAAMEGLLNACCNFCHDKQITSVKRGAMGIDYFLSKKQPFVKALRHDLRYLLREKPGAGQPPPRAAAVAKT